MRVYQQNKRLGQRPLSRQSRLGKEAEQLPFFLQEQKLVCLNFLPKSAEFGGEKRLVENFKNKSKIMSTIMQLCITQ